MVGKCPLQVTPSCFSLLRVALRGVGTWSFREKDDERGIGDEVRRGKPEARGDNVHFPWSIKEGRQSPQEPLLVKLLVR